MNGLSITTLGENTMIMEYETLKIEKGIYLFTGLKAYYDANDEPVKGTREDVIVKGQKIAKQLGIEFTI